jgi:hypothetical protein
LRVLKSLSVREFNEREREHAESSERCRDRDERRPDRPERGDELLFELGTLNDRPIPSPERPFELNMDLLLVPKAGTELSDIRGNLEQRG